MKGENKKDKKENQWNNKNKSMDKCNEAKNWLKLTNLLSVKNEKEHKCALLIFLTYWKNDVYILT